LELNPSYSEIRDNRARLFKRLSISEQLVLGISHFEQGRTEQAKGIFEAVLVIDSTNETAKRYLSKIAKPVKPSVEPSETPTATPLEDIQADAKIWPLYLDGLKFMRDKEYQKAIEAWQKVLSAYPNSLDTKNNISQAKLRLDAEKEK
jgi:tetratricopeptide (TPR) repeat protein